MNIEQFLNGYEVENMWVKKGLKKNTRSFLKIERKTKADSPLFTKGHEQGISPGKNLFSLPQESARE